MRGFRVARIFSLICASKSALSWFIVLVAVLGKGEDATTHLFLAGGGYVPDKALTKFLTLAKEQGKTPRLLVISWASAYSKDPNDPKSQTPAESAAKTFREFSARVTGITPAEIKKAPDPEQMETYASVFLDQVAWATAIFFTGGNQNLIMDVLNANPRLTEALRFRFLNGCPVGGTSAGTAIMSRFMFTGEGNFKVIDGRAVTTAPSLGFITSALVDTHFIVRMRENRLFGVLLAGLAKIGLGLDEDGALEITDDQIAENVGPQLIMVVDAVEHPGKLLVDLIRPGDIYDLVKRQKIGVTPTPANAPNEIAQAPE